ncbi:Dihydroxyacetone ABC transport system, ATP-binding protein [Caballeronia glathei]|uniref:ABC transporter ATP-binding protein n=1 Tax=Caballeronia glathei TaxID=60547 RepID=A0A069PPC5_9BURK|nr:ABC transporter ATP-binding protein [Caballeronia glathei]KDR42292.1 ABC transporter ATP-binding protein [Caballeronia glathei]CDY76329.1 Dihydroxyacetone ABC transport system, ATP-binding protein [Caballeronia glathei]
MAEIELRNVSKRFGAIVAVDDLSLDVKDGEFVVVLGPSGAGKTTTLRLIAGLEGPDSGDVLIDGEIATRVHPSERDVAFIFQQYSLYPHLSVFDNLAFPLRSPRRRQSEAHVRARVEAVAAMLHMEAKLANMATHLSGGEMQRVAIGRALVREPRVFLMDEPLSSLDAKLREELRVELKRLHRTIGATIVYVTHDQVEATTLADRIAILEHGRLVQIGTPREVYGNPACLSAARRLGSPPINLLPPAFFDASAVPADTAVVAIRPEDVVLDAADRKSPLSLKVLEYSPLRHLLILDRDGTPVVATTSIERNFSPGQSVGVSLPARSLLYFRADGRRIPT